MDAIDPSGDFQGWELLQANSDAESDHFPPEIDSEGFIQTNYFSSEPLNSYGNNEKSAVSENPSWIDPVLGENLNRWSDSSSERSENREFTTLEGGNEVGSPDIKNLEFGSGVVESTVNEIAENESGSFYMDSVEIGENLVQTQMKQSLHPDPVTLGAEGNHFKAENQIDESVNEKSKDANKERVVWWRMPIEFLKCCVFRMPPVWTVSFAAAVVGFVILGRRLYRMKNKARALELKVTVDDKKVSQAMSRTARLNEAFTIVKRVPVIFPSLPAVGSSGVWPVMSLR